MPPPCATTSDAQSTSAQNQRQMDSKRRQEEPSAQNAKRSNYAAKYKREYRSQQLATLQPKDKAEFLAKEAQRKRESRARKKGENECRSTLQPADRAAFLAKEAQRKRESRARKRTTSTTVAIEIVWQAPVVNDESTDKSLSDTEDNDPLELVPNIESVAVEPEENS